MAKRPAKSPKQQGTVIGPLWTVKDLTGGVNLRTGATSIKPEESRRLVGADVSSKGELGVYPGWVNFTTSSLGAFRISGAERIYIANDPPFTLVASNGGAYKPSDAGVWGSAVLGSLSTVNQIDFVYDRQIVAIFDGA